MLIKIIIHQCPHCKSKNIVKNGHTQYGAQRCLCHDCGRTRVLIPRRRDNSKRIKQLLRALRERCSLRGIARIFNVSVKTLLFLIAYLGQKLPAMRSSLVKGFPCDQLELDEMWSFVGKRHQKRWLWVILCRHTRQIVAYCIGDRSNETFKRLYRKLPTHYQACYSFSDLWKAYKLLDPNKHKMGDKGEGYVSRLERWNNTLRQRISRYVRQTLSFSKKDKFHHLMTKIYIWFYNMELKEQLVWRIYPSTY